MEREDGSSVRKTMLLEIKDTETAVDTLYDYLLRLGRICPPPRLKGLDLASENFLDGFKGTTEICLVTNSKYLAEKFYKRSNFHSS